MCDESRNALHHPLSRPLAAHVDIAIIGVAQIAVATSLELSVEFVEHEAFAVSNCSARLQGFGSGSPGLRK